MGQVDDMDLRRKAAAKPKGRAALEQRKDEFVRLELDKQQTVEYRLWRQDMDVLESALQEMIEDGYKFTLRWDNYSKSPAAFCFPDDDSDNWGYILSGRGGTGLRALAELLYKHAVVLRGVWVGGVSSHKAIDDPDW